MNSTLKQHKKYIVNKLDETQADIKSCRESLEDFDKEPYDALCILEKKCDEMLRGLEELKDRILKAYDDIDE